MLPVAQRETIEFERMLKVSSLTNPVPQLAAFRSACGSRLVFPNSHFCRMRAVFAAQNSTTCPLPAFMAEFLLLNACQQGNRQFTRIPPCCSCIPFPDPTMRSKNPHKLLQILVVFTCIAAMVVFSTVTSAQDAEDLPVAEFTAADVFPGTTAAYVEIRDPATLLRTLFEHPVAERFQQLEAWKQALRGPGMTGVLTARNFLELQFGKPWRETLTAVTAKGIYFAFDASDRSAVLLVRGRDADLMQEVRLKLLELTRLGGNEIRKLDTYRDIPVYRLPQGGAAVVGEWLVAASTADAGRKLLDRILDLPTAASPADSSNNTSNPAPPQQPLAAVPAFRAAISQEAPADAVRAWIGLVAVRDALQSANRAGRGIFTERIDNPVAELLLGGLQSVLGRAEWARADLRAAAAGLQLRVTTPFDAGWVPEQREWYFGPQAAGRVPDVPEVPETVGTIGMYRNVSEMWLRAGDLFSEQINDRMAEAESNLGTIFAGRDFGEEVLGAIEPEMLLLAARQDFTRITPAPAIRLPSFALLLTLKDPDTMRPELRRIFQSVVGFGNIVGAQQGQPQLELDMQKLENAELITARYLAPKPSATTTAAPIPIVYNFSPTIAFQGNRVILASSTQLAEALLKAPAKASPKANAAADLSIPVLRQVFNDNRDTIVSGNMLSKGQTREEADAEFDLFLQLLSWFSGATASLTPAADSLQLKLNLHTAVAEGVSADAK
jgi:hypothetical protein